MEREEAAGRPVRRVPVDAIVDLVTTLATGRFCAALLRQVNAWLRVDHCALVRLTPGAGVQLFGAESVASFMARGARAVVSYVDRFHRVDPIRRLVHRQPGRAVVLQRERAADVADHAYRRACYDDPGIVDRIAVVVPDDHGGVVALVMHRQASSGEFGDVERDALREMAPLLAATCARHVELVMRGQDASTWRTRLSAMCPGISGRELDVAGCLLAGRTMRETAGELGIAHSSVVTYAERAYGRLAVRNLRELRTRFASSPSSPTRALPLRLRADASRAA
jgi:DNA-binding CsgD family transcriptional regulator